MEARWSWMIALLTKMKLSIKRINWKYSSSKQGASQEYWSSSCYNSTWDAERMILNSTTNLNMTSGPSTFATRIVYSTTNRQVCIPTSPIASPSVPPGRAVKPSILMSQIASPRAHFAITQSIVHSWIRFPRKQMNILVTWLLITFMLIKISYERRC